ncbi:unnamed protein product, partial [marine sediment metagenome]
MTDNDREFKIIQANFADWIATHISSTPFCSFEHIRRI